LVQGVGRVEPGGEVFEAFADACLALPLPVVHGERLQEGPGDAVREEVEQVWGQVQQGVAPAWLLAAAREAQVRRVRLE